MDNKIDINKYKSLLENIKQEESQQEMIPLDGRKRLTSLLAAVINDTEDNEDDDDV